MTKLRSLIALLASTLLIGGTFAFLGTSAGAADPDSQLEMSIAEVDLDGPRISDIVVTLTNTSEATMTDISVEITGPINWTLYPEVQDVEDLAAGATTTVTAAIHVPNNPAATVSREFTATAAYDGGDGRGSSATERIQFNGEIPDSLAELFNNVGTTTVETIASGDYDGDGNSFSRERMAELGLVPGATIEAAGTEFTWPDVEPGEPDNVSSQGQTFNFAGRGQAIAFLGAGVHNSAQGEATVHYADGSTSQGTFGFPNWGFHDVTAFGATLEFEMNGRNTPDGFMNEEYEYRIFSNTIEIDPTKDVTRVTLPNNSTIHVFAIAFVPAEQGEPTLALDATTDLRCVVGKTVVVTRAENLSEVPVEITMTGDSGERTFAEVAPGKAVSAAFTTRAAAVEAGTVTVTATAEVDGTTVTGQTEAPHDARTCG